MPAARRYSFPPTWLANDPREGRPKGTPDSVVPFRGGWGSQESNLPPGATRQCRRGINECVHFRCWHKSNISNVPPDVCYREQSRPFNGRDRCLLMTPNRHRFGSEPFSKPDSPARKHVSLSQSGTRFWSREGQCNDASSSLYYAASWH